VGGSEGTASRLRRVVDTDATDLDEPAVSGRLDSEAKDSAELEVGGRFSSERELRDDTACTLACAGSCSVRMPLRAGRLLVFRLRLLPRLWNRRGVCGCSFVVDAAEGASRTEP
jgi:hypothetical protein